MKLKAGPRLAWQKYVFLKPPWDWTKIFRNYHQHLISFSDLISTDPRQLNPTLNTLKTVILKYEKGVLTFSERVIVVVVFVFLWKGYNIQ